MAAPWACKCEPTDQAGNATVVKDSVRVPHDESARALASLGFSPDGTRFVNGAARFALVIPSLTNAGSGAAGDGEPLLMAPGGATIDPVTLIL